MKLARVLCIKKLVEEYNDQKLRGREWRWQLARVVCIKKLEEENGDGI